jgi:ATP-dependent exoDNAse (exonuclease V) alpha subunit
MAEFSLSMQIIKRSEGRSAVAAAAYRAGERLRDERTGITHDYSRRGGVERTEIMLPENAPGWCRRASREQLWNTVEEHEKRRDSQICRDLRLMIPRELDHSARLSLVRDYVQVAFVSKGMVADVCWHNKIASDGLENIHAHVMLTMRRLSPDGFGPKSRHDWIPDPSGARHPDGRPVMVVSNKDSWNCPDYFDQCRLDWERIANEALERAGSDARIDRRSLLERGLARLPEPALRLAWHLKSLYGCMKVRFGQYQMAKHFQAVERAARGAYQRMDETPMSPADRAHTVARFSNWFERQLDRLRPSAPAAADRTHDRGRDPGHGLER